MYGDIEKGDAGVSILYDSFKPQHSLPMLIFYWL